METAQNFKKKELQQFELLVYWCLLREEAFSKFPNKLYRPKLNRLLEPWERFIIFHPLTVFLPTPLIYLLQLLLQGLYSYSPILSTPDPLHIISYKTCIHSFKYLFYFKASAFCVLSKKYLLFSSHKDMLQCFLLEAL